MFENQNIRIRQEFKKLKAKIKQDFIYQMYVIKNLCSFFFFFFLSEKINQFLNKQCDTTTRKTKILKLLNYMHELIEV